MYVLPTEMLFPLGFYSEFPIDLDVFLQKNVGNTTNFNYQILSTTKDENIEGVRGFALSISIGI
jgi:hypothetical protein